MMRIVFLLSFFLLSCADGTKVPAEILPPTKMEAVLYDVISADELADFSGLMDSTYLIFSKRASLYDSVFSFHSTNKENFKKSLQFYQGRPDLLKTILYSAFYISLLFTSSFNWSIFICSLFNSILFFPSFTVN